MIRKVMLATSAAGLAFSVPATAQSMQGMDHGNMPGMGKPAKPAAKPKPPIRKAPRSPAAPARPAPNPPSEPARDAGGGAMEGMDHSNMPGMEMPAPGAAMADPNCPPEHAKMGHCKPSSEPVEPQSSTEADPDDGMAGMSMEGPPKDAMTSDPDCPPAHAKMGHCTPKAASLVPAAQSQSALGTDLEPGSAPAPSPPSNWYADRVYSSTEMARAREEMMKESGGTSVAFASFDLAEYVVHRNKDSYRWDGEAWLGGDINRFVFKYEGEGEFGGSLDDLELSALYSRAIDPYWNLQAGVRYDPKPDPSRVYAVLAVEGLAPYWFEVTASAFLSNKGEFRARLEGFHDVRLTQKLILQPRLEANFSAQTIPELGVGAGLSNLEVGARLRYEIKREFAPYIGFEWVRQFGDSARFTRASGGQVSDPHFVMGVRLWF